MKKLLTILVAAVAVSTVFAKNTKQGFETDTTGFVAVGEGDVSDRAEYGTATKPSPVADLFDTAGDYFLELDTGDATLWATNSGDATFFDMNMQFNPCATAPEVESGMKIAVYLNTASNLVVISGPGVTTNVTATTLEPGTWGRLTISATNDLFTVSLNGTVVGSYASLTGSATVQSVGFKGSGALDNYVARTTDPFLQNPVATVDGEGYATFAEAVEALADAPEGQKYVTLLDDIADPFTVTAVGSLAVKRNSHNLTVVGADGLVVGEPVEDPSTGITTYSAVEGVAAWSPDGTVWNWRSSFEAAYNEASGGGSADLKVKINGDFAPSGISASKMFYTITFLYDAEDNNPATIVLTNGNYKVTAAETYSFPANATLVLPADFTVRNASSFGASGVLNIPEGVKVTLDSYTRMNDLAGVTGAGTIDVASDPALFIYYSENNLPKFLRAEGWKGVLEISGSYGYSREWNFADFGNPGSTIRFKGLTASYLDSSKAHAIGAVELVGDGFTFNGAPTANKDIVVSSAVRGSGALNVATTSKQTTFQFTGDVSDFTGNVTVSGTGRVAFGSDKAGTAPVIYVHQGASVTNTGTWTAENVIVSGELVANGTMSATTLWGNSGTGVYRANNSAAAIAVAPSWNGTYVIGWAGAKGTAINFNSYGNSGSKIVVPEGSTLQGYIDVTANNTLTNNAEVVVNGVLNLSNGYDYSTVVWKKLSGSGTVKYAFAPTHWIKEKILELDRFTGSIEVSKTTKLEIESVNLSADAVANVCVVPIAVTSGGTVDGDVIVKVNGTENGQTLKYRADGLYVAIDIAIPAVDNMTASVTVDGVDTAIVDGGVAVASGARVVVTYAANEGYVGSGEVVIESASASSVVDTTGISATTAVAQVGETKYGSLAKAVAAATSGATVTLLSNITLDERVEPSLGANTTLTIDLGGFTITREGTSGNGSVFDVKSGVVTITNGVINCTQNDAAIVADGVYAITARNGASVTLGGLNVAVDSQAGACVYPFSGATVTILSGTYRNDTADDYQYKAGWRGMAVNQVNPEKDGNVRVQRITIYGGSFKQVNPALGDDSWTDGAGTFLASGKTTRLNGSTDYWDVVDEYTITLDANGGSVDSATVKYAAGDAAFDLPIPTLESNTFLGWTNETIVVAFTNFVPGTTAALGDLTLYAKWDVIQPTDPWNTPSSDAGVADALSTDGLVTESAAVTTVAGFNALVDYITNHVDGVAAPGQMTANQKANAVLCYALNATTIPDTLIESATIDAITQPDASGAMTLTVAIPGVPVGETVNASLLEKVVSAKGGTALGSMSAENVTVTGYGAEDGKVVITVTPKVPAGDPAPTTFFTSAVITK